MMSEGQVSKRRKWLIDQKLLQGECYSVNNGNQVWHLKIPDLWDRNNKLGGEAPLN